MKHTISRNNINSRYILSSDLLKKVCDSTNYQVEDDFEYLEFFSKELVLIYSGVSDEYYKRLIERRKIDLESEEELIHESSQYITLPQFTDIKRNYIHDNVYDFFYLSQLDDNTLLFRYALNRSIDQKSSRHEWGSMTDSAHNV